MAVDFFALGQRIQNKRKSLGKTQENMAEALQVSVGYISQVERGITKISLDTLSNICDFLDCSPAEVLEGTAPNNSRYMLNDLGEILKTLSHEKKKLLFEIAKVLQAN